MEFGYASPWELETDAYGPFGSDRPVISAPGHRPGSAGSENIEPVAPARFAPRSEGIGTVALAALVGTVLALAYIALEGVLTVPI